MFKHTPILVCSKESVVIFYLIWDDYLYMYIYIYMYDPQKMSEKSFITNVVGFLDVTTKLAQFLLVDIPI